MMTFRLIVCALALATSIAASRAAGRDVLVLEVAETSQIDGRDWDKVLPGNTTVDAVHRAVLLRFPGAAAAIKSHLDRGERIEDAEIALEYEGYELSPQSYLVRDGLGVKKWKENPPTWHVIAWPLREPWIDDQNVGPTFRARIKGYADWADYGARDTRRDRFPLQLGPAELSARTPLAHLDITRMLTTDAVASDIGMRLRALESQGVLIQKLEEYDSRYRDFDAYEWAVPTGGHGLTFSKPRLIVQFVDADRAQRAQGAISLPPPLDISKLLAPRLTATGTPSQLAPEPNIDVLRVIAAQRLTEKPSWMTDTQFARVRELLNIGGDSISGWLTSLAAGDPKKYQAYLREMWLTPPRYWKGWSIQDDILLMYQLRDFVPDYLRKHLLRYWVSWLMPDIPTDHLLHPVTKEAEEYARTSGDWRGRASFFRAGYNYGVGTQNFNHTAALGALLAGNLIGSQFSMADGRNGLERLLLRYWSFADGSSQEMLDHYYLSITLSAQKMLADFGPTAFDRLAGRIMLERTMEMLATIYHPELGRFVGPSGRARMSGVLVEQDGIYAAIHALSDKGVLRYADKPFGTTEQGMPVWGYDFPPGRVALQSLTGPWAPSWFSRIIDHKGYPFEEVSAETIRGNFSPPLWRTSYLGHHYGLASQDIKGGTVDVLGQWTRTTGRRASLEELGTLTLRYCINRCDLVTTSGGILPASGGIATFQQKNRAIVLARPPSDRTAIEQISGPTGLNSLATVLALWNFQSPRTWELFVDGAQKLESDLPLRLKAGQVLTIKDGPSYVGIRALPASDLGRGGDEIVVALGGYGGKSEPNRAPLEPTLTLTSYNFRSQAPVAYGTLDWDAITTQTFGGFVIELGDQTEYRDFADFTKWLTSAELETKWLPSDRTVSVRYRSGREEMTAGFATDVRLINSHFPIAPGTQVRVIQNRFANGKRPYLEPGIDRDTSWSQQGSTGKLEKNGVVLLTEPGRKAYLIADREAKGILAYNPLPDPTPWQLLLPDGAAIKADGNVGLFRVAIDREANTVEIDHAARDERQSRGLARTISLLGFGDRTQIRINGLRVDGKPERDSVTGKTALTLDLRSGI
jgi:hypothetical protein